MILPRRTTSRDWWCPMMSWWIASFILAISCTYSPSVAGAYMICLAERWDTLRHSFSHYDLDIAPVVVRIASVSSKVADHDDSTWYRPGDAPPGGIAAPVMKLIETLGNTDEMRNHG